MGPNLALRASASVRRRLRRQIGDPWVGSLAFLIERLAVMDFEEVTGHLRCSTLSLGNRLQNKRVWLCKEW